MTSLDIRTGSTSLGAASAEENRRKLVVGAAVAAGLVALYFLVNALHPLGPGVIVKGIVVGGLNSLVAMGLVLIYRSARIINFSQQVIGGLAATMAVLLVGSQGLPWILAVAIGLVVAVFTGWLVEAAIIQRFVTAPRLILTVVTIGIYQILGAAELGLPNLFTLNANSATTLTTPFNFNFYLRPFTFTGDDVVALVVIPLALVGLYWFFIRTDYGVAIRGAADSPERAVLLGIPVRSLSRITWMVAAGLSGVGAILSAPKGIGGFSVGSVSTPATLLLPLAAAVLAGMESFPLTVAWSLVLGVVNEAVFAIWLQGSYEDVAQFIVIIAGLLIIRARSDRADDQTTGEFVAVREVAALPRHVAKLREVRIARGTILTAVLAAVVLVPLTFNQSNQLLAANVAIYAVIGVSIVVLTGWAGQISLGQFAFVGVGAATAGALLVHTHVDFLVATLAAAVVGALVAVIVGIPALRIPGLYLAVATLAFAVPVSSYLLSSTFFPSINPTFLARPILLGRFDLASQATFYEVCLVFLLLAIVVARNLRNGRTGRNIIAVRDNPKGASAYGISALRTKLLAFIVSGAIAGVAGSLYEVGLQGIKSGGLPPDLSITVFVMVVIGGLGSISGAVLGAIYVQSVAYFLPGSLQLLATGAGLLLLLLFVPEGLGGLLFRLRNLGVSVLEARHLRSTGVQVGGVSHQVSEETGSPAGVAAAHLAALRIGALEEEEEGAGAGPGTPAPDAGPSGRKAAIVGLHSINAGYGNRSTILHDVEIGIGQSEVVALLGTNGAGKTTVLRAVAGLLRPTKGGVSYVGSHIEGLSAGQRVQAGLVTVLGGRGVFRSLTVEENLRLAAWTARRHHKDPVFATAATERVLTLFPVLRERLDQRAGLLSGGEQQMLALAEALLCRPKLLMIDELSLGLAPSVVAQLLEVIRALAASGVTVVIVEQSVNVATAISSRAIFIERGRVRFSGPTPDLSQQPKLLRSVFLHAARRAKNRSESALPAGMAPRSIGEPSGGAAAFSVVGVSKRFGGLSALGNVHLSVAAGEIVGIIGSNGAGKTTLFDVCSGFTRPDQGQVLLSGVDITRLSPARRAELGVGRVFQDARLFPSLTVVDALAASLEQSAPVHDPLAETLGLSAVVKSDDAIRDRVDELIEEMGLSSFRDRFVSELSTGTRRVLELACAVAHRPRVLLLDEPTAGIAQRESEALGELLLGLREQTGAAFVVIEHDVPLVSSIADRLLCMHLGEVISAGATSDVLTDPLVVAAYLGTDDISGRRSGPLPGAGVQPAQAVVAPVEVRVPVGAGVGAVAAPPGFAPSPPTPPGFAPSPPVPPGFGASTSAPPGFAPSPPVPPGFGASTSAPPGFAPSPPVPPGFAPSPPEKPAAPASPPPPPGFATTPPPPPPPSDQTQRGA